MYRLFILSFIIIFSCAPYSIHISNKHTEPFVNNHSHRFLEIYSNENEIEGEYNEIAKIQIKNNRIYGNIVYDERMKSFLLRDVNEIDGCFVVMDYSISDSIYTYFNLINLKCCKYKEWNWQHDLIDSAQIHINSCDSTVYVD